MTVVLMPRMQTSRAYEFMGVNPPSFPSIPPHENAALSHVQVASSVHTKMICSCAATCRTTYKTFPL